MIVDSSSAPPEVWSRMLAVNRRCDFSLTACDALAKQRRTMEVASAMVRNRIVVAG